MGRWWLGDGGEEMGVGRWGCANGVGELQLGSGDWGEGTGEGRLGWVQLLQQQLQIYSADGRQRFLQLSLLRKLYTITTLLLGS